MSSPSDEPSDERSDERRRRRSYRPGSWYAVLGDRATVLLPPSERARVADLWQLLDGGAGFDDALDALIASGLRGLPGFVLASETDGETRIVLRGAARAVLTGPGGEEALDGASASTWVERSVRGVTRLVVEVGEPHDDHGDDGGDDVEEDAGLRLDGGLVRVRRLEEPPADEVVADRSAAPAPPPFAPASSPYPFATPPVDHAGEGAGVGAGEGAGERAGERAGEGAGEPLDDPEATQAISVAAADELASADAVTDRFTERDREHEREDRAVARLAFSSGERVDVDRPVLVGRAPEARRFAAGEQPRLVTVPSPHQEVSSTHLEVRPGTGPDRGVAVATDLGSTNGTWLVASGEEAVELRAGLAERLLPGAVLDLGDGVTIRVD